MIVPEKADTKFESEDLPKILAALANARNSKAKATVTVHFADNGGVIAVKSNIEKNYK